MIDQELHRRRLVAPVADVLLQPHESAQLDTQVLFGEEVTFIEHAGNFTKIRTSVDHKTGWVRDATSFFRKTEDLDPATHRVRVRHTFLFSSPDYKEQPKAVLSMNSPITVSSVEMNGNRKYARIEHFMGGTGWVRASALRLIDECEPDFVAAAELFIGSAYGWERRDANPGIDCSALLHAAMLAAGRKSCARDSSEQATSVGEVVNLSSLRDLRRGDLVFLPGHVLIMTGSFLCVHATERDPYNKVLSQPLQQVLQDRAAAGDSCEMTVRRFPQYQRQQLRRTA